MTTKYTPMMEQYLSVKAQAKDAFLFFRLGDFYEMFFEDAVNAARELEITLTGRDAGAEERVPMCGVPYHSAESYITRLIEKGFKVAICEQVENPAEAKGVVRREIVRVVTPGTVMEGKALPEKANNYLAAVAERNSSYALAVTDLTTGELYCAATGSSLTDLLDELSVYSVSEAIGSAHLLDRLRDASVDRARPAVLTARVASAEDEALLMSHFPNREIAGLAPEQRLAVSLLLSYLQETQKRALSHISSIRIYETNAFMTLDPFTRKNLELTETARDRSRKGSLLSLLDRTVTALGSRMLRRWLDKPLMSMDAIGRRLDAVEAFNRDVLLRDELREALKLVYDLERLAGRIAYGTANARDLIALKSSLSVAPRVLELCRDSEDAALLDLVRDADDCGDVYGMIDTAIHPEPSVSLRDGGIIRDGYNERLDRLREASGSGKRWISELEQAEREATGIKSLKIGFNKVFGYYIEITRSNLGAVPEGRYERKQTLATAERFVTPELKEKEALILEAEEKTSELEYELFAEVRERIAVEIPRLQRLSEQISSLDALQSLATVAAANRYVRPDIHDGYDMSVNEGRHPVVESVLERNTFISNDTMFSRDGTRALLITGPNMAGKSTYMRQVALISIMAQIGSFVPAKKAVLPIIDRIFTRIGAADDLAGGQSTFMVEMRDIQTMIAKATPRSLVVIDELGRGTSTGEGMAIAQAVIEHLHEKTHCKTLVSTHYHELAHLEQALPYLSNACMAVKESGDQVTFLRKLVKGAADTSYGIYCAQLAGLPNDIIQRAYTLLSEFEERARVNDELSLPAREAAAGVQQLDLFKGWGAPERVMKPDPEEERRRAAAAGIVDMVRHADLLNMTPLEAMNLLFEMKRKAQETN